MKTTKILLTCIAGLLFHGLSYSQSFTPTHNIGTIPNTSREYVVTKLQGSSNFFIGFQLEEKMILEGIVLAGEGMFNFIYNRSNETVQYNTMGTTMNTEIAAGLYSLVCICNQSEFKVKLLFKPMQREPEITSMEESIFVLENIPIPNAPNYIISSTPRTAVDAASYNSLNEEVIITYYDGLGRPVQIIKKGSTPLNKDLISITGYDQWGRESEQWNPVPSGGSSGFYYHGQALRNTAKNYYGDQKPYQKPLYSQSPDNTIIKQFDSGSDWYSNDKGVKTTPLVNTTQDDPFLLCSYFYVTGTRKNYSLNKSGNYNENMLFITQITDEEGNISFEFKDKLERILLTRQVNAGNIHDTFYIYDDFGNLCFVIPPIAAGLLTSNSTWSASNTTLKEYAYLYKYDDYNRCVAKKLPGCEWIYYIYDKADQLICMQDGVMRTENANKWLFTIPDTLGRPAVTGTFIKSMSYTANPLDSVVVKATRTNATDTYKGYSISGISGQTSVQVLTANYYDDYNFIGTNGITSTNAGYNTETGYNTRYTGGYKGTHTGTITAQIDPNGVSTTYLYSVMYYDNHGRIIQTKSNNHLAGGIEKEYIAYNFTGQPLSKKYVHSATGKTTQTELYAYAYDHAGRLTEVKHGLNTATANTIIATNTYDDLGRLKTNKKGSLPVTTYTYNVRSWMKSITSTLFTQTLYYNDSYGGNTPQYNGNISAMTWKTQSESLRGYTFAYDNLSRITQANYLVGGSANANYKVPSVAYDKHGNITYLERWGKADISYGAVDKLTMTYSGNQLTKVTDSGTTVTVAQSSDFKDYSNVTTEYTYNTNGSLTKDLNKGISSISYNFLSLPSRMDIKSPVAEARNDYTYSAGGKKLKVIQKWNPNYSTTPVLGSAVTVSNLSQTKTTVYVGNKIYENNVLKRTLIDGGYIEGSTYYYYLTDHLGNNRVVATGTSTITQKNHYYPFGMTFGEVANAEQGVQPYKYNGKELDRTHGLNWYDYSARYYDPAVGRFMTVDPLAEKYYSISPYAYCDNNPIGLIDPDGRQFIIPPVFGLSTPLLGTSNPIVTTGRGAGMLGTADKVARALPKEEHHIVPRSLKGNETVKAAREGGFKLEGKENKIPVDKFSKATGEGQHAKHPKYTEQIKKQLTEYQKENPDATPKQAAKFVRQTVTKTKNTIKNNPDTKINDLKLKDLTLPTDNVNSTKPEIIPVIEMKRHID